MKHYLCLFWLILAACTTEKGASIEKAETLASTSKPNIIFIYADDLGYGDLSSYGADSIHTPYMDNAISEGVKFTNFYSSSPICSPSRTSLLTGKYHVRTGVTRVFFPNSLQGLDPEEYTMAEMFKENGYSTGLIGKWHLGHLPEFLPNNQGFDYWFGLPYSNDMEWEPRKDPPLPLMRNGKTIAAPVNQKELTQRYSIEAKYFIAKNRNQPFFLYIAHAFPHVPLHVSKEYEGTSKLGLYGDVVQEIDRSVGEVFDALKTFGLEENTIVVFSSDNGPVVKVGGSAGGLRGQKTTTWEGGIKVPTWMWWKGKIDKSSVDENPYIMMDWLPTFANIIGADMSNQSLDGINILPNILGEKAAEPRDFFFYFNEELRAVRSGQWKYKRAVMDNPYKQRALIPHEAGLFNLENDPNEQHNLIETNSALVTQMEMKISDFEKSLGELPEPKLKAIPFDDPRKKKKQ